MDKRYYILNKFTFRTRYSAKLKYQKKKVDFLPLLDFKFYELRKYVWMHISTCRKSRKSNVILLFPYEESARQ